LSALGFDRLFSMSAFDGLRSIRKQALQSPGLEYTAVINIIRNIDSDAGGLDFEAALELDVILPAETPLDVAPVFYRCCISDVVLAHKITWARSIMLGRTMLLKQLNRDEQQCFRSARLLEAPPPDDVVEWWDTLSGQIRHTINKNNLYRGRQAEKLSLEHEINRLRELGINMSPLWVSVDDNTVGYDILSYDLGEFGPMNRMIEVKSTIASPLHYNVSRNEWEKGRMYGKSYHFHIWNLAVTPPRLYERTLDDVLQHIPFDQRKGKWTNVDIPVGGS